MLYHLFYDLVVVGGVDMPWFFGDLNNTVRSTMAGGLIFLSGISCHLTRSNLKRGVKTFSWAMAITAITYFFLPDMLIMFGVLHLFGSMMLIYAFTKNIAKRIPPTLGFAVCFLMFFFLWGVPSGYIGLFGFNISLPPALYQNNYLFFLGFIGDGFMSADFYPLLPWGFLFYSGVFFGRLLPLTNMPDFCYYSGFKTLRWLGSNTLMLYLLHQPLFFGVVYLLAVLGVF